MPYAAIALFLVAGLCLSSLDTTAKYLVRDQSLLIVVWARYAGQMLVVTPFAWKKVGGGFWRTRRLGLQLLRSTALLLATAFFFAALRFLPLAEASAISFLSPVIIVLMSGPVLGERPSAARWIAAIAGFLGILIIVRPGSVVFQPAALMMVATALCNATYQLLTRKLLDENVHTTLFYSALVGTVALSLLWLVLPSSGASSLPDLRTAALFLMLGVFAGTGHWLIIAAYGRAPASLLTPFTYLQMIWATLFGYLVFGHLPDRWSAIGMSVIVISGLLLALREQRRFAATNSRRAAP